MMKRTLFKFLKKKDSPMRLLCEAECLETGAWSQPEPGCGQCLEVRVGQSGPAR